MKSTRWRVLLLGNGYQGHEEGQHGPAGDAHPACPAPGVAVSITSEGSAAVLENTEGKEAPLQSFLCQTLGIFRTKEHCELLPNCLLEWENSCLPPGNVFWAEVLENLHGYELTFTRSSGLPGHCSLSSHIYYYLATRF